MGRQNSKCRCYCIRSVHSQGKQRSAIWKLGRKTALNFKMTALISILNTLGLINRTLTCCWVVFLSTCLLLIESLHVLFHYGASCQCFYWYEILKNFVGLQCVLWGFTCKELSIFKAYETYLSFIAFSYSADRFSQGGLRFKGPYGNLYLYPNLASAEVFLWDAYYSSIKNF